MESPLCNWSDKLVFGIARIDAQHKNLFDLAATFEGNGDQIRFMKTLAQLSDYIRVHFREEESLLEQCSYPHLAEHKALHVSFKEKFQELLQNAGQLTLDEIAAHVHYLINGWFYNHIMVADLDYVPFVKALKIEEN